MVEDSDFTKKFRLLIKIEELAFVSENKFKMVVSEDSLHQTKKAVYFNMISINNQTYYFRLCFDYFSYRDGFHDLSIGVKNVEIPYFKNMNFEDESLFILSDEYQVSKFIKLISIEHLLDYYSNLKGRDYV